MDDEIQKIQILRLRQALELIENGYDSGGEYLLLEFFRYQLRRDLSDKKWDSPLANIAVRALRDYIPGFVAEDHGLGESKEYVELAKQIIGSDSALEAAIARAYFSKYVASIKTEKKAQASRENIKKAHDPALHEKRSAAQKARHERERRERQENGETVDKRLQAARENIQKANDPALHEKRSAAQQARRERERLEREAANKQ